MNYYDEIKNNLIDNEINYYIHISINNHLSITALEQKIKSKEDKTIGIIICKKDNKFYMEYCSDDRIIAREYKLV